MEHRGVWHAFCFLNAIGLCVLYLTVHDLQRDRPLPRPVARVHETLSPYGTPHRVSQEDSITNLSVPLCDVNTLDGLHNFSNLYLDWILSGTRKPLTNSCTLSIRPSNNIQDIRVKRFYKAYDKLRLTHLPFSETSRVDSLESGIGCAARRKFTNRQALSHGMHKFAYRAKYYDRDVVVRTPFIFNTFSKACLLQEKKSLPTCYAALSRFFIEEIWYHQILRHTSIIKLLGFCVPNKLFDGTVDTTVTMVTEVGVPLQLSNMTWDQKLQFSYEVAELMAFASQHPNGSVEFGDFALHQFVMVKNKPQFVDMEAFRIGDIPCHSMDDCASKHWNSRKRAIRVPCVNGFCVGLNEKLNVWMYNFRLLEKYILPEAPLAFREQLDKIVRKADEGKCGIEVIKDILRRMRLARPY
ncbi:uncharacterized protein LOC106172210 [Lingula anatina]|uniref:Uncharacterized protein LOC106172210 n=1 Tax=Lingula anatina TaxID=7574 RepID=A0A1S3JEG8_LINAN|nr:uncharacterized protein LOC106172210 [Lingula anatina]|eukprot:XP_013408284.1 uncharacterized protein LOC106172210 [Lingula anatina]